MDLDLKNKVIIVTGGAKGIGLGNVWNELADLALAIAGRPLPIEPVTS